MTRLRARLARAAEGDTEARKGTSKQSRRGEPVAGEFDKRESFAAILNAGWLDRGRPRRRGCWRRRQFQKRTLQRILKDGVRLGEAGQRHRSKTGRAARCLQLWRTLETARPAAYEVTSRCAGARAENAKWTTRKILENRSSYCCVGSVANEPREAMRRHFVPLFVRLDDIGRQAAPRALGNGVDRRQATVLGPQYESCFDLNSFKTRSNCRVA